MISYRKILPTDINMIDGNIGTVKNLKWTLEKKKSLNEGNGNIIFYNSGVKVEDKTKLNNYSKLYFWSS